MDFLIALAVLPGFALMLFFHAKDKHEPEPGKEVARMMAWGAAVSIVAVVLGSFAAHHLEAHLDPKSLPAIFVNAFILAALLEESLKFLVVKKKIYEDPNLDEPYDGIVYCVAVSLGFAIVENIFYVLAGGFMVGIARALLAVPAHALFGVFMGYFVGLSKFTEGRERTRLQVIGLGVAVLAHGLYDFVLFTEVPMIQLTVLPMMGLFWCLGLWKVRTLVNSSPFKAQPKRQLDLPLAEHFEEALNEPGSEVESM